jgi:hypothetical protein
MKTTHYNRFHDAEDLEVPSNAVLEKLRRGEQVTSLYLKNMYPTNYQSILIELTYMAPVYEYKGAVLKHGVTKKGRPYTTRVATVFYSLLVVS